MAMLLQEPDVKMIEHYIEVHVSHPLSVHGFSEITGIRCDSESLHDLGGESGGKFDWEVMKGLALPYSPQQSERVRASLDLHRKQKHHEEWLAMGRGEQPADENAAYIAAFDIICANKEIRMGKRLYAKWRGNGNQRNHNGNFPFYGSPIQLEYINKAWAMMSIATKGGEESFQAIFKNPAGHVPESIRRDVYYKLGEALEMVHQQGYVLDRGFESRMKNLLAIG
jgi:hypothetical protein